MKHAKIQIPMHLELEQRDGEWTVTDCYLVTMRGSVPHYIDTGALRVNQASNFRRELGEAYKDILAQEVTIQAGDKF